MRLVLGRRLTLGVAALLAAGAALVGVATSAHAAGPSATFVKTSEWGNSWEAKYTVNGGDSGFSSWKIEFDLPATAGVNSYWDAKLSKSGNHYVFENLGWNGNVPANGSVSFGLIGSGQGATPANCTINGASCGGGSNPTVPAAVPNFKAASVTDTTINLSWDAPSGSVTGYRIYKSDATPWATVSATSHSATGLGKCSTHTFSIAAYNSVGEGAKTPMLSATTSGCVGGTLPKHLLTGYWHNFVNGAVELKLRDVPAEYDVVAVAFGEATGVQGEVTFGVDPGLSSALGGYSTADFRADVKTLQSRSQRVIFSVGGELGRVAVNDAASAQRFADSAVKIIRDNGFDGIDIDLENGLNATHMGNALRKIREAIGSNLIIMMAPQTIDMQNVGMEYFKLALNIKDILTVVNMQYYNSGAMLGCDQMNAYSQGTINFLTALACIQTEGGLRPDQVALGLPASPGAANGGSYIAPATINNALNCLARGTNCGTFKPPHTYPGIRGAMTWSINWDVTNGNGFANTIGPFLNTLP